MVDTDDNAANTATSSVPPRPTPLMDRRAMLVGTATFIAGGVGGHFLTYWSDWFSAMNPASELADAQTVEPPVRAIVVPERIQEFQGELWTYPGRISTNPQALDALSGTIDNFDTFHQRMYALGFHDTGLTLAKLLVEGRRNAPVRVIGIRARILDQRPLEGEFSIVGPGAEGGTNETVQIGFDLADRTLTARKVDEMMPITLGDPFFAGATTELERGEQEVYTVIALAAPGWDIDWELVIEVIAAGAQNPELVVARRQDAPFRTLALHREPDGTPAYNRYTELYNYNSNTASGGPLDITFVRSTQFGA